MTLTQLTEETSLHLRAGFPIALEVYGVVVNHGWVVYADGPWVRIEWQNGFSYNYLRPWEATYGVRFLIEEPVQDEWEGNLELL